MFLYHCCLNCDRYEMLGEWPLCKRDESLIESDPGETMCGYWEPKPGCLHAWVDDEEGFDGPRT